MGEKSRGLYNGGAGYITVDAIEANGQQGAVWHYANPDPRKLHAVDTSGMQEFEESLAVIEEAAGLSFLILRGAFDPVHAGADITEFAAEPDYAAIRVHLLRGAALDARIKQLWPRLRTVAIFSGDRYGGSFEWPLFAEYGVADSRCTVQLSEVTLGIIPGWNGVLNVLLKSGPTNALYMGQTGNKINASQMQQLGLVQQVVDTPPPPDRVSLAPEAYEPQRAEHAQQCQHALLQAALGLATQADVPAAASAPPLATPQGLANELSRRTDPAPYRELQEAVRTRLGAIAADDPDAVKQLGRYIGSELAQLGRPLAPLAVKSIAEFVQRWSKLSRQELLSAYCEAGQDESERCAALMDTPHRVKGVNAVLSKDPLERVPVFD